MNRMKLTFLARSENEVFARNVAAAFALPLNPTLSELSDVKTAVSEAVTNCIVHAYPDGTDAEHWVTLECSTEDNRLHIVVTDSGKGIEDIARALTPFYTSCPGEERSGMGFTIMQTFRDEFRVTSVLHEGTRVEMTKCFGGTAEAYAR